MRGVSDSEKCKKCNHTDTLRHFLFQCHDVQPIWEHVKIKLTTTNNNLPMQFNVNNAIFGLISGKKAHNVIILLAKQYITSCKLRETYSVPNVETFKSIISEYIITERSAALKNDKLATFLKKWEGFEMPVSS